MRVAVPVPLRREFDFLPGALSRQEASLQPGVRVLVPFGRRKLVGVVTDTDCDTEVPAGKLRRIEKVIDEVPVFSPNLLRALNWAAQYYHAPIGELLSAALPARLRKGAPAEPAPEIIFKVTESGMHADPAELKNAPLQRRILEALQADAGREFDRTELQNLGVSWKNAVKRLMRQGWVAERSRLDSDRSDAAVSAGHRLTPDQQSVVAELLSGPDEFRCALLHGVTGSGKTEVYLQLIAQTLARGQQVLFLVPEIGLTPQVVERVTERFGVNVGLLHSGLGENERHKAWWQAGAGKTPVVLGTRSAVFAPFSSLGLVIVDEEHDGSFKQQDGVRYHARDFAIYRSMCEDVPCVLGSATPSLESLKNARDGNYQYLVLPQRVGGATLPEVGMLDMRGLPEREGLSPPLIDAIELRLERGEQTLVFLNRRGFAPLLYCRDCDWRARCLRCDSHLTHHQKSRSLRCHHCGYQGPAPVCCPDCGGEKLIKIGVGTERLEEELRRRFPAARVARIDRDSTRRKGELERLLAQVRRRDIDILLGTQLLTKGHDFSGVTLVGIVNVDQGLFSADFRASEILFQQVMQVSGRAGRRKVPGQVLIQTWVPDHTCFRHLMSHDYDGYSEELLSERMAAGFPPYGHMALLRAEATKQGAALNFLHWAREMIPGEFKNRDELSVFDPVASPMERRAGRYRAQLLLRAEVRKPLHELLGQWLSLIENSREAAKVRWTLDVDPVDMY